MLPKGPGGRAGSPVAHAEQLPGHPEVMEQRNLGRDALATSANVASMEAARAFQDTAAYAALA